ncbi:MAG: SDR family NAD(P)-dependent oxidoreductase [Xanthobacteraceae bacterium]
MSSETNPTTCRRLDNRVAIVTGGAGGIGRATVRRLAAEGAKVEIFDAVADGVAKCVADFRTEGLEVHGQTVDVGDDDAVERATAAVTERHGRLDIMVCGAGVRPVAPILETTLADWHLSLKVNLTGVFVCGRAAARRMLPTGKGSIVVIASINAMRGVATMSSYNASKAGTLGLINTMAAEWGPTGVRTNGIAPAQIETPMIFEQVGELRRRREERIPLGRYGKPHEIADAVAFLASDDASFVNGHLLCVDGGYTTYGITP